MLTALNSSHQMVQLVNARPHMERIRIIDAERSVADRSPTVFTRVIRFIESHYGIAIVLAFKATFRNAESTIDVVIMLVIIPTTTFAIEIVFLRAIKRIWLVPDHFNLIVAFAEPYLEIPRRYR